MNALSPQPPSLLAAPRRLGTLALLLCSASLALQGCAVVTVAGAAISVTGAVVSTGVTVAGKVVGKTIDAVTPSSTPD